jgi:hypothetical protein
VQFKTEEPAHARFATLGISQKDAMLVDPFGIADFKRSRVDEADACIGSIAVLQIGKHWNQYRWNKSDTSLVADQMRKFARQMNLDMLNVIGFKSTRVRLVKMNEDRHDFARAQLSCSLTLPPYCHLRSFPGWRKAKPKIIEPHKTIRVNSLLDPSNDE